MQSISPNRLLSNKVTDFGAKARMLSPNLHPSEDTDGYLKATTATFPYSTLI